MRSGLFKRLPVEILSPRPDVEDVRFLPRDCCPSLADVHLDIIKKFCDEVIEEAVGQVVTKSLKPGQ